MSGKITDAPFGRGKTLFGGAAGIGSTDGHEWEGREFDFPDKNWSSKPVTDRGHGMVRVRCVRNLAAFNILPGMLCKLTANSDRQVDGMSVAGGEECYPADEFLPAAGVKQYDLFYVVVRGPALIYTGLNADATNVINAKDPVSALTTASSSGGTSAGRVKSADYTGATAVLGKEVLNTIGYAMSAATTANTNSQILVDVRKN